MKLRRSRKTKWVPVKDVVTANHELNPEKVKKYLTWFSFGSALPPLQVSCFGEKYLLMDGHHRLAVALKNKLAVVEVMGA